MKLPVLTEEEARVLREIVREFRRKGHQTDIRPVSSEIPPDETLTPEVHIVEIPTDGIPAGQQSGSDFIPGSALCTVHKISGSPADTLTGTGTASSSRTITQTSFGKTVYNVGTSAITRSGINIFRIARRDKYGDYVVGCD